VAVEHAIEHMDLHSDHMRFIEKEPPFALPAVFVEFLPIRWTIRTNDEYEEDIALRLHILTDSRVQKLEDVISAFDLMEDILLAKYVCIYAQIIVEFM
jgi:hypothetical protein